VKYGVLKDGPWILLYKSFLDSCTVYPTLTPSPPPRPLADVRTTEPVPDSTLTLASYLETCFFVPITVLRIRDILVRIWIRGSVPMANGPRLRILLFSSVTFKMTTIIFFPKFFSYYYLKLNLHHFSKIKSHKEVTKR
jgi:hypothetical protein